MPLRNPGCSCGNSNFVYGLILFCMTFSKTLLAWGISAIVLWLEHSLASPFLGSGMYTNLFSSDGRVV